MSDGGTRKSGEDGGGGVSPSRPVKSTAAGRSPAVEILRVPGVLHRREPLTHALPLVFDSPHSGSAYPADFRPAAPMRLLRMTEDFDVDQLFAAAPAEGAVLLAAEFPRCYIDANRPLADLDRVLLEEPWPGPVRSNGKSRFGAGLIWRLVGPAQPIYARQLSVAEVVHRIDHFYQPYHQALARSLDRLHREFGAVWHVDCHSMPSRGVQGSAAAGGAGLADFVVGDLDGASAGQAFRDVVVGTLRGLGYRVTVNKPYKGDELVRRHGDPAARRQSVQIEINRRLYMDEIRVERHAGFSRLQSDMTRLIAAIAAHVRAATPPGISL